MPTINLHTKKEKRDYQSKKNNLNHQVYNTMIWKNLRLKYLSENPLCERCILKQKYIPAVDVHHKYEIDNGDTLQEKQALGYDYENLEALCRDCHKEHHRNKHLNKN